MSFRSIHAVRGSGRASLLPRIVAGITALAGPLNAQLQPPIAPPENPLTHGKVVLGKILFWDEQFSSDNSMACGTCHVPARGGSDPNLVRLAGPDLKLFTEDDGFGSPGVVHSDATDSFSPSPVFGLARQVTGRNSPSFIMGAYFTDNFWDGRARSTFIDPQTGGTSIQSGGSLESQLVGPPVSSVEMAHDARTWGQIAQKLADVTPLALARRIPLDMADALRQHATYPALFRAAFGDSAITSERIAFAIASYERSLVPDQAPWDRYNAGDYTQLTPEQIAGQNLFNGRARCFVCHPGPRFTDDGFHTIGVRPPAEDLGRQIVTGDPNDRGKFKTPSLRNASLRRRFMHNGGFGDLRMIVEFYERGGDFSDNLDPQILRIVLSRKEESELVQFIGALTDPRVEREMHPFDRPLLHSEGAPNPLLYGDAHPGSGGFVPVMVAPGPPNLGNDRFKLGVGDALGGSVAILGLSGDAAAPGTTINGIPVNIALTPPFFLLPFTLQGAGAGGGYATFGFKIPADPQLAGQDWYAQWFIADPGAAGGFSATAGVRFDFF